MGKEPSEGLLFDGTIHRREGIDASVPAAVERKAVRAVIEREGLLLLVRVGATGEYKFPGGGVEAGEGPEAALAREVEEETGHRLASISGLLGRMTEYDRRDSDRPGHFRMVSGYYAATVARGAGQQSLDDYERRLGFVPAWISPLDALRANKALLSRGEPYPSKWIHRETEVLRVLASRRGGKGEKTRINTDGRGS